MLAQIKKLWKSRKKKRKDQKINEVIELTRRANENTKEPVNMFLGRPLRSLPMEFVKEAGYVPSVIKNAGSFIEKHIKTKDIFQTQGNPMLVRRLITQLGSRRSHPSLKNVSVHDVIEALKTFLVHLPEPFLPESVCDDLISSSQAGDDRCSHILINYREQQPGNFAILTYLMNLFRKVVEEKEHNNIDARKLATIFVLDFIKPLELDDTVQVLACFPSDRLQRLPYLIMVMEVMITTPTLFQHMETEACLNSGDNALTRRKRKLYRYDSLPNQILEGSRRNDGDGHRDGIQPKMLKQRANSWPSRPTSPPSTKKKGYNLYPVCPKWRGNYPVDTLKLITLSPLSVEGSSDVLATEVQGWPDRVMIMPKCHDCPHSTPVAVHIPNEIPEQYLGRPGSPLRLQATPVMVTNVPPAITRASSARREALCCDKKRSGTPRRTLTGSDLGRKGSEKGKGGSTRRTVRTALRKAVKSKGDKVEKAETADKAEKASASKKQKASAVGSFDSKTDPSPHRKQKSSREKDTKVSAKGKEKSKGLPSPSSSVCTFKETISPWYESVQGSEDDSSLMAKSIANPRVLVEPTSSQESSSSSIQLPPSLMSTDHPAGPDLVQETGSPSNTGNTLEEKVVGEEEGSEAGDTLDNIWPPSSTHTGPMVEREVKMRASPKEDAESREQNEGLLHQKVDRGPPRAPSRKQHGADPRHCSSLGTTIESIANNKLREPHQSGLGRNRQRPITVNKLARDEQETYYTALDNSEMTSLNTYSSNGQQRDCRGGPAAGARQVRKKPPHHPRERRPGHVSVSVQRAGSWIQHDGSPDNNMIPCHFIDDTSVDETNLDCVHVTVTASSDICPMIIYKKRVLQEAEAANRLEWVLDMTLVGIVFVCTCIVFYIYHLNNPPMDY